jgi:hypothetical protein
MAWRHESKSLTEKKWQIRQFSIYITLILEEILILGKNMIGRVQTLKHFLVFLGEEGGAFQEGQGYPAPRLVGFRGVKTNYFPGGPKMGDVAAFQVLERGEDAEGEDLALLKRHVRIYMEVNAAQADVSETSLPLTGSLGIREASIKFYRQGYENPVESSSFQKRGH